MRITPGRRHYLLRSPKQLGHAHARGDCRMYFSFSKDAPPVFKYTFYVNGMNGSYESADELLREFLLDIPYLAKYASCPALEVKTPV